MRFATSILLLICFHISFAQGWKLEKDDEGIKIYTREVAGSDVKEFKALTTINASRLKIAKVLTRITDFINWYPDVIESKVIKEVSSTERIIYYQVDVPWPADNRDVVLDFKVQTNKEKKETKLLMVENLSAYPERDGVVRMPKAEGFWKLTTISDNKTNVHYQFLGDPGGSLPTWLINMFLVDSPFDTIMALKEKVE